MSALDAVLAAAAAEPAGGASIQDIGLASAVASFALIFVLMGGLGHRGGVQPIMGWFERFAERVSGQPAWASLPCGLAIVSLISALFGLYWDVSLHIDVGRDVGPLNNTAHWFILAGLYGIFAAGFFAICLGREERADRPGPTAIRINDDWYAPLGGVLMCATGAFSLIGFPLDDGWHRLFGQDVTLWGPTHLMLIGGAAMTLLAIAVIQVEAVRAMKAAGVAHNELAWVRHLRYVWLPGGLLVGLSTFTGEFDWGVPQFQLVYHPMLLMLASSVTLVATRIWLGRGTALGAVLFFIAMRGLLALSVGPGLGESVPHFPLLIVEAAIVELVALAISVKRPVAFAAACGALIGTVGLAAEWAWTHIWAPLPWPQEILGETIALGLGCALAGAFVGTWIGTRLNADELGYDPGLRWVGLTAALAAAAMLAFPLYTDPDTDVSAKVTLRDVDSGAQRTAMATVTLSPRDAADGATWFTATAWQGGGLVVDHLRRVREGVYRTTQPIPLYGEWKTMIRLHKGNSITGLPIFAPADAAIPAPEVPAPRSFERPFFSDKQLLQREAKTAEPAVTWGAYGTVLTCTVLLLALLAWGIHRIGVTAGKRRDTPVPPYLQPAQPPRREDATEPTLDGPPPLPDDVWPARIPVGGGSARS